MKKLNSAIAASLLASLTIANAGAAHRFVVFGDSISQSNASSDQGVFRLSAGYAEQAIFRAGRHTVIANVAEGGNTTAQLRARLQSDVLSLNPSAVLLMAGTNSILDGGNAASIAAAMDDIEAIVVDCLSAGVLPVLVTPPAKAQGITGAALMREAVRFYYVLANHYNVPLIDVFKVTVNPATGFYKAGLSDDGTHPNPTGRAVIAQTVAAALQNLSAYVGRPYVSAVAETDENQGHNLLRNGTFTLPTTSNPNEPLFWYPNLNTGVTAAIQPAQAPVFSSNWLEASETTPGWTYSLNVQEGRYALYGAGVNQSADSFEAGDVLVLTGRVSIEELSGVPVDGVLGDGMTISVSFDGSATACPLNSMQNTGDFLFSQEIVVPVGAGQLTLTAYVQDKAKYTFNNFTLWNKTKSLAIWTPGQAA
jgi:lysophospholipase L1-like esterase